MALFVSVTYNDGTTEKIPMGDHLDLAVQEFARRVSSMAYPQVILIEGDLEDEDSAPKLYGMFQREGVGSVRMPKEAMH